jgi:Zn finger protein HypA/HybF involved in hydrogenase expression
MIKKWNFDQLKEAVKISRTLKEVCEHLNLNALGSSYKTVKKYITLLNIDISHFKTQSENAKFAREQKERKNLQFGDIFILNSKVSKFKLKSELLNFKDYKCQECNIGPEWNNKKLVLQLDHINGINNDNRLENLRFLCPNCHSQTDTFAGKNCKKEKKENFCKNCNIKIYKKSIMCKKCSATFNNNNKGKFKIMWPDDDQLILMIAESNILSVAKKLNVSYNAVKKRIKLRNLKI